MTDLLTDLQKLAKSVLGYYCSCPEVLNAKPGEAIPCNEINPKPIHSKCGKEIKGHDQA